MTMRKNTLEKNRLTIPAFSKNLPWPLFNCFSPANNINIYVQKLGSMMTQLPALDITGFNVIAPFSPITMVPKFISWHLTPQYFNYFILHFNTVLGVLVWKPEEGNTSEETSSRDFSWKGKHFIDILKIIYFPTQGLLACRWDYFRNRVYFQYGILQNIKIE